MLLLETVVFVRKRVVVFKTVVLFETILVREDDATDPVAGNARECICIRTLSHVVSSVVDYCVARIAALKRGEGKKEQTAKRTAFDVRSTRETYSALVVYLLQIECLQEL